MYPNSMSRRLFCSKIVIVCLLCPFSVIGATTEELKESSISSSSISSSSISSSSISSPLSASNVTSDTRTTDIGFDKNDTAATTINVPTLKPTILDTLIVHLINSHHVPSTTSNHHHQQSIESNQPNLNHISIVQQFAPTLNDQRHQSTNSNSTNTSNSNSTIVAAPSATDCIDGSSYWNSRDGQCMNCTTECPNGAYAYRNCNRTADLQCMCHKGAFMSVADGTCKKCSECQPGWGVWRTCRWSRNTVCRKCQPGTYSGANVGTLGCIPCTKCGPYQEMLSECDGNRDTVCVDRATLANYSHYFINPIDDPLLVDETGSDLSSDTNGNNNLLLGGISNNYLSESSQSESQIIGGRFSHHNSSSSSSSFSLPFYFAILVVIVFSLCIYALIQLRCSIIHNHHHHNNNLHNGRSSSPNDIEQNKLMMLSNSSSTSSSASNSGSSSPNSSNNCLLSCSHNGGANHSHTGGTTIPITWTTIANSHSPTNSIPQYPSYPPPQYSFDIPSPLPIMHLYRNNNPIQSKSFQHRTNSSSRFVSTSSSLKKSHYKAYYELLYAPNEQSTKQNIHQEEECSKLLSTPLTSANTDSVSQEIQQILENKLGKDSECWKLLARELGYTKNQIIDFEIKSSTSNDSDSNLVKPDTTVPTIAAAAVAAGPNSTDTFKAIRLLLADWSSSPLLPSAIVNNTNNNQSEESQKISNNIKTKIPTTGLPQQQQQQKLSALTKALVRIGRVDCARIIHTITLSSSVSR